MEGRRQPTNGRERRRLERRLRKAIGPQEVRLISLDHGSRLAWICIEADYRLKRLALGLDASPVPAVRHSFVRSGRALNRFWFTLADRPLRVSAEGDAFRFTQPLRLRTSGDLEDDTPATPSAERYAERFTRHLPEMAAALPGLAELWNATDLALLAALIRREQLHEKAGWELGWLNESGAYPMDRVPTPRSAETLVNSRGRRIAADGVVLRPVRAVRPTRRNTDTTTPWRKLAQRPGKGRWFRIEDARSTEE